jgi:hypothetical protein
VFYCALGESYDQLVKDLKEDDEKIGGLDEFSESGCAALHLLAENEQLFTDFVGCYLEEPNRNLIGT